MQPQKILSLSLKVENCNIPLTIQSSLDHFKFFFAPFYPARSPVLWYIRYSSNFSLQLIAVRPECHCLEESSNRQGCNNKDLVPKSIIFVTSTENLSFLPVFLKFPTYFAFPFTFEHFAALLTTMS